MRWIALLSVSLALALWPACAVARPASGPRESVDEAFTTTAPAGSTGLAYRGAYHASDDPNGNPPYMRRMTFYLPAGMRLDTSVPDRCAAPDVVLQAEGPDACSAGSRIGAGTTEGLLFEPFAHAFVLDHFQHNLYLLNGANEQILLVQSEGYTVVRGHIHPDGSIEFGPPTCFPSPPTGQCPDDYVLQLKSTNVIPPYTRASGGHPRSYATTPPTCPSSGAWQTTIKFWWADGSVDGVASREPCSGSAAARRAARRHRARHVRRRRSR